MTAHVNTDALASAMSVALDKAIDKKVTRASRKPKVAPAPEPKVETTPASLGPLSPREAGRLDASSTISITAALRAALPAIDGEKLDDYKSRFEPVRREFYIGNLAHALAYTDAQAELVLDKPMANAAGDEADKSGATRRTVTEEKAYATTRKAWSRAIERADVPTANVERKSRAPKTPKVDAPQGEVKDAPLAITALSVPKAETIVDIAAYMQLVATNLAKFRNENVKAFDGEAGMPYRDLVDNFVAAVKAISK
jgi:hypothetical protein